MKKALTDSLLWRGLYFISSFIINILVARAFAASLSGWIYYISNNFYLILLLGSVSLDSGITYFAASKKIHPNRLAGFSALWPFVVWLFGGIVMGAGLLTGMVQTSDTLVFAAGSAYIFGISLLNFFTALFYADQNYATPNSWLAIINVLMAGLLLLYLNDIINLPQKTFLYIYFFQFVLQGVGLACIFFRSNNITVFVLPTPSELKPLFRFSVVALSANIAYYLIYRVDYLFVEAWCSPEELGNYVQVSKMGQLLLIIPTVISSAIYPQTAMGNHTAAKKLIRHISVLLVGLYILLAVGTWLWAHKLFIWVFGPSFNLMYYPFLLLLPGILCLSVHTLLAAWFGGRNHPGLNVVSTGCGLLVVLAGDWLFIKPGGIVAAALVSSAGYTVACGVGLLFFIRLNKRLSPAADLHTDTKR